MTSIRALLGLFPNTENYEAKQDRLRAEYQRLGDIEQSEDWKRYQFLDSHLKSDEFLTQKKELQELQYKGSGEHQTEQEFILLSKRKDLKRYFATANSQALKDYLHTSESEDLIQYQELQAFIQSEAFKSAKIYYALKGKEKFKRSDLHKTYEQFQHLSKNKNIIAYQNFTGNKLYKNFEAIDGSDKLKKYEELTALIESSEFTNAKNSLSKRDFKASENFKAIQEHNQLKNDKSLRNYFKLKNSSVYTGYLSAKDSEEIVVYEDLKAFIQSEDFKNQRRVIEQKKFTDSEEYQKFEKYNKLAAQTNLKQYFKFGSSKELSNYHNVKESSNLLRFVELKKKVESDDFRKRKAYLSLKGKQRWEQSEGSALEKEFETLSGSEDIKWLKKHMGHKRFQWLNTWKLTFEDDFRQKALDTSKWISKYFYGERLLNNSYSLAAEYAFLTDGKNLEFSNNTLHIKTRIEAVNGMAWSDDFGFIPRVFQYTSGIISSGASFRQQYGTIEAKICFSKLNEVTQAFWMVAEGKLPHIDIAKAASRLSMGIQGTPDIRGGIFNKPLGRSKFADKFFIYSMEWLPGRLVWKINGITVATTDQLVPETAMYLNFSSHLFKEISNEKLPDTWQIDWVRCYQHSDYMGA